MPSFSICFQLNNYKSSQALQNNICPMPSAQRKHTHKDPLPAHRRMSLPPAFFAYSQLKRAVRAPPTCRLPVGDGANRTRTCTGMHNTF
jgi:hypothetical protein